MLFVKVTLVRELTSLGLRRFPWAADYPDRREGTIDRGRLPSPPGMLFGGGRWQASRGDRHLHHVRRAGGALRRSPMRARASSNDANDRAMTVAFKRMARKSRKWPKGLRDLRNHFYSNKLSCWLARFGGAAGPKTLRPPSDGLIRCS